MANFTSEDVPRSSSLSSGDVAAATPAVGAFENNDDAWKSELDEVMNYGRLEVRGDRNFENKDVYWQNELKAVINFGSDTMQGRSGSSGDGGASGKGNDPDDDIIAAASNIWPGMHSNTANASSHVSL